ncbi:MAG: hypothetical protein Q8K96_07340 [Rubrivivax sp.]|nr:hypothetical protein [Rubrivivax sp.]
MTSRAHRGATAALVLGLAACAPTLDWREVRPAHSGAALLFPCRPNAQERAVALAGESVRLALHACSAGGQTWGLAFADLADPARVGAVLAALRAAAATNLDAPAGPPQPLPVPGATPNAQSARVRLNGHSPDGKPVQMQLAVFAHGARVFQATVVGPRVPEDAAQVFFSSIRFSP